MQQLPPQPAYILHSRPFRDTSLILELLTPEYGRIACIAKGARRDKQRRQRALQPFSPLLVTLLGRHDLKTLGPVEAAGQALWLKGRAVYAGLYVNELLMRLLPEGDAQEPVFAAYQSLLQQLAMLQGECNRELEEPLRRFEIQLLLESGNLPQLDFSPLAGKPVEPSAHYRLVAEDGLVPVVVPPGCPLRGDQFSGADLLALAAAMSAAPGAEPMEARVLATAKRLGRLLLRPLLGERPLKSRELFRQVYLAD
ncbi:DNA repair protein RecO [uncultured Microbulbifer sp.]|uniref:DNA repair protein RecO n=1 Tax=uncultured Microbulbifer sp. TaxID=348147 RepID=UPI0025FDE135|nr:DNA repair protein RecO [uncultured Microbulbifer sp.]